MLTCELCGSEHVNLQRNWVAFKLEANDAALSCIAGVDAGLLVELPERCSLDCFPCLNFAPKSLRREDVYINNDENKKAEF